MTHLASCFPATSSVEFKWKEKTYNVSLPNKAIRAKFEQKNFSRALECAQLMKGIMSKAEYKSHLDDLSRDYNRGKFALEAELGQAYVQTVNGVVLFCSLLFNIGEEEMERLWIEAKEEITALLNLIHREALGEEQFNEAVESQNQKLKAAEEAKAVAADEPAE